MNRVIETSTSTVKEVCKSRGPKTPWKCTGPSNAEVGKFTRYRTASENTRVIGEYSAEYCRGTERSAAEGLSSAEVQEEGKEFRNNNSVHLFYRRFYTPERTCTRTNVSARVGYRNFVSLEGVELSVLVLKFRIT